MAPESRGLANASCLGCHMHNNVLGVKVGEQGNRGLHSRNHAKTSISTHSISSLCTKDTKYISDRAIDATREDCMLDRNIAGDTGE